MSGDAETARLESGAGTAPTFGLRAIAVAIAGLQLSLHREFWWTGFAIFGAVPIAVVLIVRRRPPRDAMVARVTIALLGG
jgi:hypothetical protein